MKWRGPACAVALLLSATACSSGETSDYGQYLTALRQGMRATFGRSNVTLSQAAAIPYASMGWRLDKGPQQILVLATDNAQGQLWTSASHVVLLTQAGRVTRTVGLPQDLAALAPRGHDTLTPPARALSGPYTEQRTADFSNIGVFGAPLDCRGAVAGAQAIVILGKKIATSRVDEHCESPTLQWSFVDSYWVDKDSGFVWRARQHTHPKGGLLETEIFRPPG